MSKEEEEFVSIEQVKKVYSLDDLNEAQVADILGHKNQGAVISWRKTHHLIYPFKDPVSGRHTYKLTAFLRAIGIDEMIKKGVKAKDIRSGDLARPTDDVLRIAIDLLTRESTLELLKKAKKAKKPKRYKFNTE